MKETYPIPTHGKKPPAPNLQQRARAHKIVREYNQGGYIPNFTGTRADWEEAIFRHAHHFNVFRLHRRSAIRPKEREVVVYATFPEATADAKLDPAALVYAITLSGDNFCVPRSDWERYSGIWDER